MVPVGWIEAKQPVKNDLHFCPANRVRAMFQIVPTIIHSLHAGLRTLEIKHIEDMKILISKSCILVTILDIRPPWCVQLGRHLVSLKIAFNTIIQFWLNWTPFKLIILFLLKASSHFGPWKPFTGFWQPKELSQALWVVYFVIIISQLMSQTQVPMIASFMEWQPTTVISCIYVSPLKFNHKMTNFSIFFS